MVCLLFFLSFSAVLKEKQLTDKEKTNGGSL